jgi:hypothetical protein
VRLIVADAYGYGVRSNSDAGASELSPDQWTEIDVRDEVTATFGDVVVRYRDTGREVTIPVGTTYQIEYENKDVVDVRTPETTADELVRALGASRVDEGDVVDLIRAMFTVRKIDELKAAYSSRAGHPLVDAIHEKLTGSDRHDALRLLGED